MRGKPCLDAGDAKPGENATMCEKRSPLVIPSDSAYDAAGEWFRRHRQAGYEVEYQEFHGPHRVPEDVARHAFQWFTR
jgi:hypothetical protein